ncbi:MAG: hypothetical protein ACO1OF_06520 [Adhaeribacter sp.]
MNKKELKAALIEISREFFEQRGFKLKSFSEGIDIFKLTPSGHHRIMIFIHDYGDKFIIHSTFGLRIDKVEEIYQNFILHNASVGERRKWSTHVMSNADLEGKKNDEFIIPKFDLDKVFDYSREFIDFSERIGLPYLETYSDVNELDNLYNDSDNNFIKIKAVHHRCMLGLTLAALTNRKDKNIIEEKYTKELAEKAMQGNKNVIMYFPEIWKDLSDTLNTDEFKIRK